MAGGIIGKYTLRRRRLPLNYVGDSIGQLRHQCPQIPNPIQRLIQADEKKLHLINGHVGSRFQRSRIGRPLPLITFQQGGNPRLTDVIRLVINHHQITIGSHPAPGAPTPGPDGLLGSGHLNWWWLILTFAALTALAIWLLRRWRQERRW